MHPRLLRKTMAAVTAAVVVDDVETATPRAKSRKVETADIFDHVKNGEYQVMKGGNAFGAHYDLSYRKGGKLLTVKQQFDTAREAHDYAETKGWKRSTL